MLINSEVRDTKVLIEIKTQNRKWYNITLYKNVIKTERVN